jgi:hypothetical protein
MVGRIGRPGLPADTPSSSVIACSYECVELQEKLIEFATRIPAFMYLTDFRENTGRDHQTGA